MEYVLAHGRGELELDDLQGRLQPKLLDDSMPQTVSLLENTERKGLSVRH